MKEINRRSFLQLSALSPLFLGLSPTKLLAQVQSRLRNLSYFAFDGTDELSVYEIDSVIGEIPKDLNISLYKASNGRVASGEIAGYSAKEREHAPYSVKPARNDGTPNVEDGVKDEDGTKIIDAFHLTAAALVARRFESVRPDSPALLLPLVGPKQEQYLLWNKIEDNQSDWLVSIVAEARDASGNKRPIDVPRSAVTAYGSDEKGYPALRIDVQALKLPGAAVTLQVQVLVDVISGGVNGFSSGAQGAGSQIAVCTTTPYYQKRSPDEIAKTLVHEVGHKINLVSSGDRTWFDPETNHLWGSREDSRYLDAVSTQYFGRGHTGSHCSTGAAPTADNQSMKGKEGKYVMFGEGWSGRLDKFCDECRKRLRRVDVGGGWSPFYK